MENLLCYFAVVNEAERSEQQQQQRVQERLLGAHQDVHKHHGHANVSMNDIGFDHSSSACVRNFKLDIAHAVWWNAYVPRIRCDCVPV